MRRAFSGTRIFAGSWRRRVHKELPFRRDEMPDRRIDGVVVDGRFLKGLELFNAGEYFESHEVIEDLWLETPSEDRRRDLYKGVIQAAAAVYQFERGVLTGARGLYRTSVGYLEGYRPRSLGLDVESLIEGLRGCFASLESWDGRADVRLDRARVPKARYDGS
jgi:uncharacterized protein